MSTATPRRLAAAAAALSTVALLAFAAAEPATDRAAAESVLAEIEALPAAHRAPATRLTGDARQALERARGARAAGDVRHGEQLEALARERAETARDLLRAVSVEAEAGALQIAAADAGTQAERARALLEEAIARRGRAEADLARITGLSDGGMPAPAVSPAAPSRPTGAPRREPPASGATSTRGTR